MTVPWETFSWRAISLFDMPSDTSRTIWRSRCVSNPSIFSILAPSAALPFGERSWDCSGDARRSVISLRDRSIVSGFAYFEIAPQTPATIAAVRLSSLSDSVKNTSRVERFSAFAMARISDTVRSGKVSARATSGAKFRIASRQLVPSLHDATISKSSCAANTDINPCRTIGCRSAITSRMQRVDVPWSAGTSNIGLTSPRESMSFGI